MRRPVLQSVVAGTFLAIFLFAGWSQGLAGEVEWEPIAGGLAVSVWRPGDRCEDVPPLLAIDIDPERQRFSVHFYAEEGLSYPPTIDDWQKRTGHDVLFNAGLFREDFSYLGLLFKGGRSLGSRRHATWQGLFAAEPVGSPMKKARVLDLTVDAFDEQQPPYQEAAQALMLLDRAGKVRVRQTGKRAYQTVVAEGRNGHILLFKSLDAVSLFDLGRCLQEAFPLVRQAMAMDGGSSADLVVREELWKPEGANQAHAAWKPLFDGSRVTHIPLPAVIGVSPR
jgi:uncharacterized protein YigE (DUF2233 family)